MSYSIAATAVLLSNAVLAADGRSLGEIASEAKESLRRIGTLSWNCDYQLGRDTDGNFITYRGSEVFSRVQIEIASGRCRFDIENFFPIEPGPTGQLAGNRVALAFDGRSTLIHRSTVNPTEIGHKPIVVNTSKVPLGAEIHGGLPHKHVNGLQTGLAYVLDNTRLGNLSELVRSVKEQGLKVSTELTQDRFDTINIEKDKWVYRIIYDRDRQCVTGFEWRTNVPGTPLSAKCEYDMERISGIWLPRAVVYRNVIDNRLEVARFTNWKVDDPIPEDRFTFEFPPKTRVVDHSKRIEYRVGDSPVAEAAAIKAYIDKYGFHPDPPQHWYLQRWVQILAGIAVIALGAVMFLRRRLAAGSFLLLLCASTGQVCAADPNQIPSHRIECGFHVTIATLEIHRCRYDADKVSRVLMKDADDGISAKSIKDILSEHQLEVAARAKLNKAEVIGLLQDGWSAILPTENTNSCFLNYPGEPNHYVILGNHPTRGPVVLVASTFFRTLVEAVSAGGPRVVPVLRP